MNELDYEKSMKVLHAWAETYYNDEPTVTNEEYDMLNIKLKQYEIVNHFRRPNCDNCTHSYICGARLACGLTKLVTLAEHWCIEHGRRNTV